MKAETENNNFDSLHDSMETKAKADKEYYLSVWRSHNKQLLNLVSDAPGGFSYDDYIELIDRLENAASATWDHENAESVQETDCSEAKPKLTECYASAENTDKETAKIILLVAECNARQPHSYKYETVIERLTDLSNETGIELQILVNAYKQTKRLIANHPGEHVNNLNDWFNAAIVEFFTCSHCGEHDNDNDKNMCDTCFEFSTSNK